MIRSEGLPPGAGVSLDRRTHARVEFEAAVTIVAAESGGQIDPLRLPGKTLDVSPSGAVIVVDDELTAERIWVQLSDPEASICECEVVRQATPSTSLPPTSRAYGVHFAACWRLEDFEHLLASLQPV